MEVKKQKANPLPKKEVKKEEDKKTSFGEIVERLIRVPKPPTKK